MIYGVTIAYLIFLVYVFINSILGMLINKRESNTNRMYTTIEIFRLRSILPIVIIHFIIVRTTVIDLGSYVWQYPINLAATTLMGCSIIALFANLLISNKLKSSPDIRFKRKQKAEMFFLFSIMLGYSVDPVYVLIGGFESM